MSNRAEAMEEAVAKAIAKDEERHCVKEDFLERRMDAKCREIVEEEKARAGEGVEKQPLYFDKE